MKRQRSSNSFAPSPERLHAHLSELCLRIGEQLRRGRTKRIYGRIGRRHSALRIGAEGPCECRHVLAIESELDRTVGTVRQAGLKRSTTRRRSSGRSDSQALITAGREFEASWGGA